MSGLLGIVLAAVVWVVAGGNGAGGTEAPTGAAPSARIYGTTVVRESSAVAAPPTRREVTRVAREWGTAWTRLTACPARAAGSLERVLARSTGDLRDTLTISPPRPTGVPKRTCAPPPLKRVEVHEVADGWYAIVSRKGDGMRPLKVRIHTVDGEPRVATIDF